MDAARAPQQGRQRGLCQSQRRRSRKEVRSQGRSRKKSQFARKIERRQELLYSTGRESRVCPSKSQPRTGHTREPDPTHNELKHTTPAPQISTADTGPGSPVSFYRESRLPPVLQNGRDVGDSDLRSMTTSRYHSVATCIVLQCPLLTVPGQSPCAGRCGYLGGFVLGFTALRGSSPRNHSSPFSPQGSRPGAGLRATAGSRSLGVGAPLHNTCTYMYSTCTIRKRGAAQQEWRRPRPSTFSPPKPLRFNAKDAPRKL